MNSFQESSSILVFMSSLKKIVFLQLSNQVLGQVTQQ